MVPHVVVCEGLLDHHQPETVEFPEERLILEGVGAVGVHHERHVRIALPHSPYDIYVPPGLDLDLDPPVATGELEPDLFEELLHGVLDTDRDPGDRAGAGSSKHAREWFALEARERVPDRHLDGGLGHVVTAHSGEGPGDLVRMGVVALGGQRPEEIADQVFSGANRFVGVARRDVGDALGIAADAIHASFKEEELLLGYPREAGLEGVLQIEPEFPDVESINLHSAATNVKGRRRPVVRPRAASLENADAARRCVLLRRSTIVEPTEEQTCHGDYETMSPEIRGVSILGATGSIGATTLEVVDRFPERFRIAGLAAGRSTDRLAALCERYRPELVALGREEEAEKFEDAYRHRLPGLRIEGGPSALERVATLRDAGFVMSAIVGAAGLRPTLAALRAGKVVGLANKESLVAAGAVMAGAAATSGARLIPVDSEHAAIHQCLADRCDPVRRIWLTASGGPFRTASSLEIAEATPETALRHPTWRMGPKITIDSATMMNKGLEMIEARWLFDQPPESIRIVVHPQSVVHSMVEFEDGSILAQLGVAHMRTPVQYALTWPERLPTGLAPLPLDQPLDLRFEPPDPDRFPCLRLAAEALAGGGDAPAVLNAANEVAVEAFLDYRLTFPGIPAVVAETLAARSPTELEDLEGVARADAWARAFARELIADRAPVAAG